MKDTARNFRLIVHVWYDISDRSIHRKLPPARKKENMHQFRR